MYTERLRRRHSGLLGNDKYGARRLPKELFSHRSEQQPLEMPMTPSSNHKQINVVLGYQSQEATGDIAFAQQCLRFQTGCSTPPSLESRHLGLGLQPTAVPRFA
jgi:hypothetical protein